MSPQLERQYNFSEVSPNWPKTPEDAIRPKCIEFYHRAVELSCKFDTEASPVYYRKPNNLRICDVRVPGKFVPLLNEVAKFSGLGKKTPLPPFWIDFRLPHNRSLLPTDEFGFVLFDDSYTEWAREVYLQWCDKNYDEYPLYGWKMDIDNPDKKYHFLFNNEGELERLRIVTKFPDCPVPTIFTRDNGVFLRYPYPRRFSDHHKSTEQIALFASGQLRYLWHEEPNGTFFPDPKGSREEIYPFWVKDKKRKGVKKGEITNEDDWKKYMKKVINKEQVLSGATLKRVFQTPKQALNSLEKWRNYIYYLHPQVFQLKTSRFHGELGYGAASKFGAYVSKNPNSHENLSPDEVNKMLEKIMPPKF
jgi:hypothetical protein